MKMRAIRSSSNTANARDRLLEAGINVFGKYGYESATTRMIAGEAGVNIAAIPYYFNGKEGLYHAVVTHIVESIEMQLGETFSEIANLPSDENGKPPLDLLETLLEKLINFMIGSPEAFRYARIILREQIYPTSAYAIILNRVFSPMIDSIARVISLTSADSFRHDAKIRAAAILGQVMAFRVARETMVRALGMEGYSSGETAEIRRVILEHTRSIITSLNHPERTGNRGTE